MNHTDLERYARHIVLREIGGPGQAKLRAARVLSIGAGGLGSPLLLYLAAAGVGTLGIVDDDVVSLSNLQRQVLFTAKAIGQPKVASAEATLSALNEGVEVVALPERLTAANAEAIIGDYDLVCDGSDNFDTRYLVNETCVRLGVPLIAGAIGQWDGQLSLYAPHLGAPCYACVFPQRPGAEQAATCAEAGVIGALPGVVGSMMALEAIKLLTGAGQGLANRLWIYDALHAETRTLTIARRTDCTVCGDQSSRP